MKASVTTKENKLASLATTCSYFGIQRDAYYKCVKRFEQSKQVENRVLELVKKERITQPRVGARKLMKELSPLLLKDGVKLGRDGLFSILRANNLLVTRKKPNHKTTNSYHRFYCHKNLVKDLKLTKPNQVWVSDITYIRTIKGFCYLALITDMYSRKIVGYDISNTLELTGCLRALQKALRTVRTKEGLIHHSDRGVQYCSNQYVNELKKHGVRISMTEENHCYENAIAERVNGILKDEFYLDQCFSTTAHAAYATKNAIYIYNNKRLHLSLDFKTPNTVYNYSFKNTQNM